MRNNKILTAVLILLFVAILWTIVQYMANKSGLLVSPGVGTVAGQPTPSPTISSYNPPKAIKYDSSTDLKKELESIDPKIDESDFN